jgi:hypothetical protein
MAEDGRKGRSTVSNTLSVPAGGAGPFDALPIRDEETVSIEYIKIQYSTAGTTESKVTLYNEPDGTPSGELDDDVDQFLVSGGDTIIIEDPTHEDITDGVVVETDGNSDDEMVLTIGGVKITG